MLETGGRRRATRVRANVSTPVGFIGSAEQFIAPLIDFSPFGLAVKTAREVKTGTIFRTGIQVGTGYFRAAAIVRRQETGMFAVEFLSMTPMDREMMHRLYLRLQMTGRDMLPN